MTAHKNSRLLPCHRGVFGVNVEPVEVCFCGLGLPDCVPPIFFNLGGQARSGCVVGRCSSIEGYLPCVSTWQRVFAVPWRMAKASRHGKVSLPCAGARQCLGAHDKGAIIAHMHGRPATLSSHSRSLPAAPLLARSQPRRRRLPAKPPEPPPPPSPAAAPRSCSPPIAPRSLACPRRAAAPGQPPPLSRRSRPAPSPLPSAGGASTPNRPAPSPLPTLRRHSTRPSCLPRTSCKYVGKCS
jgi:hypothetical protein